MTRDTTSSEYADRLQLKQRVWWKKIIPVQLPYQLNLRRQRLGVTLEVGCGIGRNLRTLAPQSVGVDHNAASVAYARQLGLSAMTVADFQSSDRAAPASFDSLLFAHVIEHLTRADAEALVAEYLPFLRPGGKVFIICPQEKGFRSDPSHVWFAEEADLRSLCARVGLAPVRSFSFPFPHWAGRAFIYNETCVLARAQV